MDPGIDDLALLSKMFESISMTNKKGIAEIEVVGSVCQARAGHGNLYGCVLVANEEARLCWRRVEAED